MLREGRGIARPGLLLGTRLLDFREHPSPSTTNVALPRPNRARTAAELVPIAGYYGWLVLAQASGIEDTWGIGPGLCRISYVDFRKHTFS
jgi:hypothetical protein